jgi:hypothetical protein
MMARLFNIITIGALLTFIFFVTAFFFIGSQETFTRQLDELPKYFFGRTAGGVFIGILGCLIVATGNFFFDRKRTDRRVRIFRIVLLTLLLSILTSVIGTGFFFYN